MSGPVGPPAPPDIYRIQMLEDHIQYTFNSRYLIWEAMKLPVWNQVTRNLELSRIGIFVMFMQLSIVGFHYGLVQEQVWQLIETQSNDDNLARLIYNSGLNNFAEILYGQPVEPRLMACYFRAIVAAVAIDSHCNLETIDRVMACMGIVWQQ